MVQVSSPVFVCVSYPRVRMRGKPGMHWWLIVDVADPQMIRSPVNQTRTPTMSHVVAKKNKPSPKRVQELKALLEEKKDMDMSYVQEWLASSHQHIAVKLCVRGVVCVVGGAACSPGDVRGDDNFVAKVARAVKNLKDGTAVESVTGTGARAGTGAGAGSGGPRKSSGGGRKTRVGGRTHPHAAA